MNQKNFLNLFALLVASLRLVWRKDAEDYRVEGGDKEYVPEKRPRSNKQKDAKMKRNSGQEYISAATNKKIAARHVKPRCKERTCGKLCSTISDDQRHTIHRSFYDLADLHSQREFLVRHIKCGDPVRKRITSDSSRRKIAKRFPLC